jgi:chromosome segregation ATPase
MTENESAKFRIRSDDNPEAQFQDDNQEFKLDKLSRRITLITILIPCLIGGILFLAYRDIQTRVGQVSDTGTTKVKTLSKDLEARFASLSTQQAHIQAIFDKKTASMEKGNASLYKSLKETDTAIRYIRAARIADNKKTTEALAAINSTLKTLTSVPQDIKNIASDIKVVDDKVSKELQKYAQTLENIKNNLIKIQADIISLASSKTDNKAFDLALKNQQKNYQLALQQTKRDIDKRIASLENKIKRIGQVETPPSEKSQIKSSQKSASVPPESKPASKAKTAQNTAAPKSGSVENTVKESATPKPVSEDKSSLPKPGSFIEQDIK